MSTSDKRELLVKKLREMFQMDQADLDFGIYRIMNAKRDEVERFLDQDLLPTLRTTLEEFQPTSLADKRHALDEAIKSARSLGEDPDTFPKVQQMKAELAHGTDLDRMEEQVFSDLLTFFSRYYQDGDFLSLRRYKEGVYALPYEGEEVKLHWANADQYYIKTAENFTRYAFKTAQGRVRFELVAGSTEHDNNKSTAEAERRFILAPEPLAVEAGPLGSELIIRFEYRIDADKRRQKELNTMVIDSLLTLPEGVPLTKCVPEWSRWRAALGTGFPADKNKGRTVLEKHLSDYTGKNTFDYFIHKDLGKFLKRELDFFIKNEVMRLDDIEEDTAARVEQYLARIKALRRIAHRIIAFLAQLENFQRKLWLKKKFVLETQWLITLDKIPEKFYPEICNRAEIQVPGWLEEMQSQRQQWVELFRIDEIVNDFAGAVSYTIPLSPQFLRANPSLVLDTAFFDQEFKDRLLSEVGELDTATDALLVHGENFQALGLLSAAFERRFRLSYIDPPYNTGTDSFIYKDNYASSSWLSMATDRLVRGKTLLKMSGIQAISLDMNESGNLRALFRSYMPDFIPLGEFIWRTRNTDNRVSTRFSVDHEYIHLFAKHGSPVEGRIIDRSSFKNPDEDPRGDYTTDPLTGKANAKDRQNLHYVIVNDVTGDRYPPDPDFGWITDEDGFKALLKDKRVAWPKDPATGKPRKKRFLFETDARAPISSLGIKISQGEGNNDLVALMGLKVMNYPKPVSVIETLIDACSSENDWILDYFAGSGTTGEAVIRLNQKNEEHRKFCLVEVGKHFDHVLRPRIAKSIYAKEWSNGRPTVRVGSSFFGKYIRLESYEDALNNLSITPLCNDQSSLLKGDKGLRESYAITYMLDVETRASMLNLSHFDDPFNLEVSVTHCDEVRTVKVDLVETFNYLLGLHVKTMGRLNSVYEVTGATPAGDRVLILWRNVNEVNNDALDEWFRKRAYNSRGLEFDLIYVNGDNNIENLRRADETWKIRLTEETFLSLMFSTAEM